MSVERTGERALRAASALRLVVTVLALYGLVLSGLLGGIAGVLASAPESVLCQQQAAAADDSQPANAHHEAGCCTAACVAPAFVARDATATAIVWPSRPSLRVAWSMEGAVAARTPPRTRASQRGPPAA